MTLNGTGAAPYKFGIYNPGFDNVTIRNCAVMNYLNGILIQSSGYNTIDGNSATSNHWGIQLASSNHNRIIGNDVSLNNAGMRLAEASSFNDIAENHILSNKRRLRRGRLPALSHLRTVRETFTSHRSSIS